MNLKIMALGGLGEVSKNCYIIESDKDIVVIDVGSKKYPTSSLGVDIEVNDISYLEKNKNKVKGILISHAHPEQMGGLKYLLNNLKVPVYGSKYTIEFLKNEIKNNEFKSIDYDKEIKIGKFIIECFSLSHSVFGHLGFLVSYEKNAIVYATDYNFNQANKSMIMTDIQKIILLKQKYNIKLLLTETKNAEYSGYAASTTSFMQKFQRISQETKGKLFITLYSKNITGMINIMEIAEQNNKKIVIVGKELLTYVNVSKKLGYIDHKYDMFIKIRDIQKYDPSKIIIVVSGDYLEPFVELENIAEGSSTITNITQDDTILVASEPYDETEAMVQTILDRVARTECTIKNQSITSSANAYEEDIKMMINLWKPQNIMPINGEYRKFKKLEKIALSLGYEHDNIKVLENGEQLVVDNNVYVNNFYKMHPIMSNENYNEEINPLLINDRKILTEEGYVLITYIIEKSTSKIIQKPNIVSGGLMKFDNDQKLIDKCQDIIKKETPEYLLAENMIKVKNKIKKLVFNQIGKTPLVLTVKIEVK